jgi:hypothetical protein
MLFPGFALCLFSSLYGIQWTYPPAKGFTAQIIYWANHVPGKSLFASRMQPLATTIVLLMPI